MTIAGDVPLDRVQAVLNMDMVGRDDCDNIEGGESRSFVYEAGLSIADSEPVLERDNKGALTGLGSKADVIRR